MDGSVSVHPDSCTGKRTRRIHFAPGGLIRPVACPLAARCIRLHGPTLAQIQLLFFRAAAAQAFTPFCSRHGHLIVAASRHGHPIPASRRRLPIAAAAGHSIAASRPRRRHESAAVQAHAVHAAAVHADAVLQAAAVVTPTVQAAAVQAAAVQAAAVQAAAVVMLAAAVVQAAAVQAAAVQAAAVVLLAAAVVQAAAVQADAVVQAAGAVLQALRPPQLLQTHQEPRHPRHGKPPLVLRGSPELATKF